VENMKNPLKQLYARIIELVFHCYYWEVCPYYNKEKCCDAWVMGQCGRYRKYEKENAK
jgi:hypothetical protein